MTQDGIITVLKNYDLIPYGGEDAIGKELASMMYLPFINVDILKENIESLKGIISGLKIEGKLDFPFLTLTKEEVQAFIERIPIKLNSLRELKENPYDIEEKIQFCEKYGIPYISHEGKIYGELLHDKSYIRGYYMLKDNDTDLSLEEIEKFIKVSSIIQNRSRRTKITPYIEETIIDLMRNYPLDSAEEIANEIMPPQEDYEIDDEEIDSHRSSGRR